MADWNIATGEEQPLNRVASDNCQVAGQKQGVLVGIEPDGDGGYEIVEADAASGAQVNAVGVLFPEEVIDLSSLPESSQLHDIEAQLTQENKTLVGDRATFVNYGIELVNDDDDTDYEPGEPVYLATGGGITQTEPSGTGEVVQVVGVVLTPDDEGRDRVFLRVDFDYEVLA